MASKRIGCNRELISENVDNLKRKVVKSLGVVSEKNNNNRYYLAEIEILKEMMFSKDATFYYIKNLGYLLDSVNRSIATYIVNFYYKQEEWDAKRIIDTIEEESVRQAALRIYNDDGIARKFNKRVFDVIIKEKPLDLKYKELKEAFTIEHDALKKAEITKEMALVKQQLKECKENTKEDN